MNKNCIRKCAILSNEAYEDDLKSLHKSKLIQDYKTDTQVHVGVENNNIYVVCRGTSSCQDVISDLKIWRKKCDYLQNTLIHSGFLEQYDSIREHVNNEIDLLINETIKRVVFCGHSLGAALATIAALDYKIQHAASEVICVTFASPRVGNNSFSKLFNKTVDVSNRIVYHRDPVTFLPTLIRFKHVKGCIHFQKNGNIHFSDNYFMPIGCLVSQHYMEKYKESVKLWLDNDSIDLVV